METIERHGLIIDQLRRRGEVGVAEFARLLGASEVTVRRDLAELESLGVLQRTHGGAQNLLLRGEEVPYRFRGLHAVDKKERIAAAATAMVRDGEAVVLDSGTTGLPAAKALATRQVTVLPLSVQEITALGDSSTAKLLLSGGTVRPGEGSIVGTLAERAIGSLRFDTYLLTCCGLNARAGVTAFDLQDAAVKQAAIASSSRVIAMVDGSKFSVTAMAVVCSIDRLTTVVTDKDAPDDEVRRLHESGVEVVRV
jgi:DeoR/GlpR family transcriptional regulator of sugar metabolism